MTKKLIIFFVFLIFVIFIMKIIYDNFDTNKKFDIYDLDGYVYKNNFSLKSLRKPIIFIHLPSKLNLNPIEHRDIMAQPSINDALVYINIKSVIKHCGKDYDVVIFDNSNISDILDDDSDAIVNSTNLNNISGKNLKNWENYAKCKILYKFGGIMMKPDFFFINNINNVIHKTNQLQITEYTNEGVHSSNLDSIPNFENIMISSKYNTDLEILMQFLAYVFDNEYDSSIMKFDTMHEKLKQLNIIPSKYFGIENSKDEPLFLSDWMSANKEIILDKNCFCIYINRELLHKQSLYRWMNNMSEKQIIQSNTNIGKFTKNH